MTSRQAQELAVDDRVMWNNNPKDLGTVTDRAHSGIGGVVYYDFLNEGLAFNDASADEDEGGACAT